MRTGSKSGGIHPYRRFRRIVLLCLCLALALALPAAGAASARAEGTEQKLVRVGWYESSFNRTDSFGRRSGYAYEYQMKVAAYTGWRFEYVRGSWSELLQMLVDGEVDLMSDVSWTAERAETFLYPSLPMGAEEYYLFVNAGNGEINTADYTTLNGKKIGVNKDSIQGLFYREWAASHGIEGEIVELTGDEDESIKMVRDGKLDGYVTVDFFVGDTFAENGAVIPMARVGASDFFFAVTKTRPDLLAELENAMKRIQEEDRYFNRQLADKHLTTRGANAFLSPAEKEWLDAHGGKIRVGYQDGYLAFCAADPETGELTGALKDYLESAADCVMNAQIEFEPRAYATAQAAMEALENGEVDCAFPANLSCSDAEDRGMFMSPTLMRTDLFAVVRQADRQIFGNREHVLVAVNEGNPNYESCLKDYYPGWRIVYYPTTSECLEAVASGVADCVLISSSRYNNIARQCEKLRLSTVTTGHELDYCFAVPAGETGLYSLLSRAVEMVPDSAVNTALSRYIAEDAKTTLTDFLEENVWAIIAVVGALLLALLAVMIRSLRAERRAEKLIRVTETDELTGLYNRDYFLEYAGRLRRERPDVPMDAVVLNIDRFHSVNAMNGREFGNRVLRTLGNEIRAAADEAGGIAGRFEADRFDIYCPHREDYRPLYDRLQGKLEEIANGANIRLRMGVMPWRDGMEAVQMFDRARTACGMARDNFKEHLIIFDEKMQERENYEQRLLNDLQKALNGYEFEVHYQPQYDIQCDPPKLVSAEALVRWNHPELGMIPPGDFVPLFERSGKIGEVDRYVWSEAARQVARWRDLYGVTIPVSVNLSRVDVFDPELESALEKLLAYNGLGQEIIKLEVTESAYTGNADQVIRVVEGLRRKGYVVEMDDFGSGYSSLNMLSAMPVDVLKMDRGFIRRIGENEKDAHLVALILGIAKSLKIPVVAEGVETEEQLQVLRSLGCSLVQGFYFSRPLPAEEFENQVILKMRTGKKEDEACDR